jgi:hypothetical protein
MQWLLCAGSGSHRWCAGRVTGRGRLVTEARGCMPMGLALRSESGRGSWGQAGMLG